MSKFADFCDRYFKQYFDLHPTDAIYYGVGGYDHLLNDYSDKSYKAEKIFVTESLRRLRQISPSDLSADEAIDYATAQHTDTARYAAFFHAMLDREVALAPGAYEVLFPGLAHTGDVVDEVVAAAREAAKAIAR